MLSRDEDYEDQSMGAERGYSGMVPLISNSENHSIKKEKREQAREMRESEIFFP